MNTRTDPTRCDCGRLVTPNTRGHAIGCNYEWQNAAARTPRWLQWTRANDIAKELAR